MRTVKSIYFACAIILFSSCKSNVIESDWGKLSLNHDVKSITEISYSVKTHFGDYVKSDYNQVDLNIGFPCNRRCVHFNKKGKIIEIVNSYGDNLVQKPIYDSAYNLLGEYMLYMDRILYKRQYTSEDLSRYTNQYRADDFVKSPNNFNDLYTGIIFSRPDISVTHFDNTPMNFSDTIVVIRKLDSILKRHNIERVDFYNSQRELFLYGELSLWGTQLPSFSYDEKKRVKFRNLPGGGKERYDYNELNLLSECSIYNSLGDPIEATTYTYDASGSIIREDTFEWKDRTRKTTTYSYDSDKRLIMQRDLSSDKVVDICYNQDGSLNSITDNAYCYKIERSETGLLKRIEGRDLAQMRNYGGTLSDEIYEFSYLSYDDVSIKNIKETDLSDYTNIITSYDEKGNWISKLCFLDNKPQVFYERIIEYY